MIPIATTLENIDRRRQITRNIAKLFVAIKKHEQDAEIIEIALTSLNFCLSEKTMLEVSIERGLANINVIEEINAFEPNIFTK